MEVRPDSKIGLLTQTDAGRARNWNETHALFQNYGLPPHPGRDARLLLAFK